MVRNRIIFPVLFALGIAAGAAFMYLRDNGAGEQGQPTAALQPARAIDTARHPMADAFSIARVPDSERIQALEQRVRALGERVDELERSREADELEDDDPAGSIILDSQSAADTPVSSRSPAMTIQNLVKAGIDQEMAADIVRRSNEIDMKLLELRDRATRDGFYGTDRYVGEVQALRDQNPALREEIGDDYYDSYLYNTGQQNRVRVVSVMMGSPAELAGMEDGDVILNYDNRRMFSWSELQNATAMGERGEYVNVTVLRNGQLHNLWIPRGPLGVRLGSVRFKP